VLLVFIVCLTFALGLSCFAATHISFVLNNHTTLESFGKHKPNPYDMGWHKNFQQVFGPSPWLYFMPVRNSIGNGLSFPRKDNIAGISDTTNLLTTDNNVKEGGGEDYV